MNTTKSLNLKKLAIAVVLLVGFGGLLHYAVAAAGEATGWAWGGNDTETIENTNIGDENGIGWISFNSSDCDANSDGNIDNPDCGSGPISDYGVNVPDTSGPLSGYAWSEHYGWISFNGADLAGCNPVLNQAERSGAKITGGARVVSICDGSTPPDGDCRDVGVDNLFTNSGGFDGCISLSGLAQNNIDTYGVTIASDGSVSGYAWSSDLGWINFAGVTVAPAMILPAPTNLKATAGACDSNQIVVTWDSGVTGATGYEIEIDNGGTWESVNVTSYIHDNLIPGSGHTYKVRAVNGSGPSTNEASTNGTAPEVCVVPTNGSCGAVLNSCTGGDLSDIADTAADFLWTCEGQNSGTDDNCSLAKPTIKIKADPALIRSGQTAKIVIDVATNQYDLACTVSGIDSTATSFDTSPFTHLGSTLAPDENKTYRFITKSLTSTQIVRVSCTAAGINIPPVEARVEVLPTIQER